jgi:hypothetical protein
MVKNDPFLERILKLNTSELKCFWKKMQAYIIFWYRCYIPLTHYKWNIDWEAGRG